jgi:hypothetical protein
MTPRTIRAPLLASFDRPERCVLAALAASSASPEEDVIARAARIGGMLPRKRYKRDLSRLLRGGVVERVGRGLLAIAEPDRWAGRIRPAALASIDSGGSIYGEYRDSGGTLHGFIRNAVGNVTTVAPTRNLRRKPAIISMGAARANGGLTADVASPRLDRKPPDPNGHGPTSRRIRRGRRPTK